MSSRLRGAKLFRQIVGGPFAPVEIDLYYPLYFFMTTTSEVEEPYAPFDGVYNVFSVQGHIDPAEDIDDPNASGRILRVGQDEYYLDYVMFFDPVINYTRMLQSGSLDFYDITDFTLMKVAAPEPSTWGLLLAGFSTM